MTASALKIWREQIAPTLECPTDPKGYRQEPCQKCGKLCGLHFGRRAQRWFYLHASLTCENSGAFWGDTREEALAALKGA